MRSSGRNDDAVWMKAALALARRAKGRTRPNPAVGAVLVRNGVMVGQGMTAAAGGPHAECRALARAKTRAAGATLYVTLEPCCHTGRTAPCVTAIVAARVACVVAAIRDPNPLVAGKGIRQLRNAGIAVRVGVCADEAARLNEDFFWWVTRKKPWISLKLALTYDGRIADVYGNSQWITSKASRRLVHELRRTHAAVAVGGGTVRQDDPSLSVRHVGGLSPARVVFTSQGRLPPASRLTRSSAQLRTIVVRAGGRARTVTRRPGGMEVWHSGALHHTAVVRAFADMAYEQGLQSVLVEGGAKLAAAFLDAGLVNRAYFFYGNRLLGRGTQGLRLARGLPIDRCITLKRPQICACGADVLVTGLLRYPA